MNKLQIEELITIDKLVHGGQGLGTLASGQKIFVWNALPGEQVYVQVIKKKKNYLEAVATEVVVTSPDRIEPKDANYLATSPWQIMSLSHEDEWKKNIVAELFSHERIAHPDFTVISSQEWQYRNKMEYSFWGDEDGLHLALYQRGTHGKQIVTGSSLAMNSVDAGAQSVLQELQKLSELRAGDLKTIIVRSAQNGTTTGALFVKNKDFPKLSLPDGLAGLEVYYSNPKSPASVPTELLYGLGDTRMSDSLLGNKMTYGPVGFFQVNIPVFEKALTKIKDIIGDTPSIDMYSGVGSIGIPVGSRVLIELEPANVAMARKNSKGIEVIQASSESALEHITGQEIVILDPPRAGLHQAVIDRILEVQPQTVCYLSCNPATQVRDIALLQSVYDISDMEVYNFFPHTPHIESLVILRKKQ